MAPRKKALVIHDHPDTAAAALMFLKKLGFEVVVAVTLGVARQLLEANPDIALALVDGGMPLDANDIKPHHDEKNSVAFLRDVVQMYAHVRFIGFSGAYNPELKAAGCYDICTSDNVIPCLKKHAGELLAT